ncbi:hypothetical protein, partial [Achromobacter xylosoxidans]|uniref:hypothetical protein n=1 Tax=Alcaligenes xylosoxydans xylosoxydans TaxID=85698 RepID=UPI001F1A63E5
LRAAAIWRANTRRAPDDAARPCRHGLSARPAGGTPAMWRRFALTSCQRFILGQTLGNIGAKIS